MRIDHFSDWHLQRRLTTDPADNPSRPYAGLAIGPGSEGKVVVDGIALQSGRIYPVRQNRYTIEKVRPVTPIGGFSGEDFALDVINDLSLILFEDPCELGACIAQPNGIYTGTETASIEAEETLIVRAPFVARRQALFVVTSPNFAGPTFDYTVVGGRWQYSNATITRTLLHTGTAVALDPTYNTYSFYMGGTDNAENWDFLELRINDGGDGSIWTADVETIGDIGAW